MVDDEGGSMQMSGPSAEPNTEVSRQVTCSSILHPLATKRRYAMKEARGSKPSNALRYVLSNIYPMEHHSWRCFGCYWKPLSISNSDGRGDGLELAGLCLFHVYKPSLSITVDQLRTPKSPRRAHRYSPAQSQRSICHSPSP